MIIYYSIAYILLIFVDFGALKRQKSRLTMFVYISLITLAYILVVAHILGVSIPSPAVPLKNMVSKIVGI